MERDVQLTFAKLGACLADQLKINADLRAEIDALTATLKKEEREDFESRFEFYLEEAKRSQTYQRQVGIAELTRKIVG